MKTPILNKILLVLILILGFGLRLSQITLTEFKLDEARVVRRGQAIAYEGELPVVGLHASVGPLTPPLTLYLAALGVRIWNDALAPILLMTLLNSLAVWACYGLTQACFDERAGLIAALLFAVSPWAVLYARKIWVQNLPLVTLGFFAALRATLVQRRPWMLVAASLCLAALLGLYLGDLIFVPIMGLSLLLFHKRVQWKPLVVSALAGLLVFTPYLIYDAQHGWSSIRGLFGYASTPGQFSWDALRYAFTLTGSFGIEGQAGPFHEAFLQSLPGLAWVNGATVALVVLALAYAVDQVFWSEDQARRRSFALLLLWFGVPILAQLRPSTPTQPHYSILLYPVQFMLVGAMLARVLDRLLLPKPSEAPARRRWPAKLAAFGLALGLLAISGWQVAVTWQLRRTMVAHPSTGGYGVPLRYTRQAAQQALALAGEAEIIVMSQDTRSLIAETATVFDALLFGHPHRLVDGRGALPVPEAERTVYLFAPPEAPLEPALARLQSLEGVVDGPAVALADGPRYRTFLRQRAGREDVTAGMEPLAAGIPFANHVVFAATDLPEATAPGESAEVWLAWWLQGPPPPEAAYHFTVQMQAARGALLAQDDHAAFPTQQWRPGDLVLSRFVLAIPNDIPAGTYRLHAGMYRYPEIAVVPVIDPQGDAVDDGVTLGEIRVSSQN